MSPGCMLAVSMRDRDWGLIFRALPHLQGASNVQTPHSVGLRSKDHTTREEISLCGLFGVWRMDPAILMYLPLHRQCIVSR